MGEENLIDSYAVLYKKEIENEDEQTFLFKPCYVVKGLFDMEEGIFLDEVNKVRYPYYDPRIVDDPSDYVVGQHYTIEDLRAAFPMIENDDEIRNELFMEADMVITLGTYDPSADAVIINDIDRSSMIKGIDAINDIIDGNILYNDEDEYIWDSSEEDEEEIEEEVVDPTGMDFYEQAKAALGTDFIIFSNSEVENLLTFTNFQDMKNYIDYIRDCKEEYAEKLRVKEHDETIMIVNQRDLYETLKSRDTNQVKKYFELARDGENVINLDFGVQKLDYNELLNTVNGVYGRITNNEECDIRGELNNLLDYYEEYLQALIAFREVGYDFYKAMTYTYVQTQILNKILKENDDNRLKAKYIWLYKSTYNNLIALEEEFNNINEKMDEELEKQEKLENRKLINKAIDETNEKLNELVGLRNVKETFNSMFANILFNKETADNLVFDEDTKHMVFTGNPGTGKTTVAELIAPFLNKVGYLESDKVQFVAAQDLIGEYVGQTAPKTQKVIDKNKGGIIILDEAYILSGQGQQFGNEAITVILKEMEKNRTMFIFAGYEKEMKSFIKMNSGIKSRIGTYLHFNDYTEEELYEMFERTVKKTTKDENQKYKLTLTNEAKEKVKEIIHEAKEIKDFGNGRFIKNLFNTIRKQHAMNTREITDIEELYLITEKDIPEDVMEKIFFNVKEDSFYKSTNMGFTKRLTK